MEHVPLKLKTLRIVTLIAAIALSCSPVAQREHAFFVSLDGDDKDAGTSPGAAFATIPRARDAIRELKQRGNVAGLITVYLRGGLHIITEPVVFTPDDSGTDKFPVTWTAYRDEQPIISGGRPVAGWKQGDKGIWTTEIPEVKAGNWYFNQLYVNGELRRQARIPNEGYLRVAGFPEGTPKTVNYHTDCQSFKYSPGDIDPSWTNLDDVEVIVYHFWTDSHLPIQSIDTATNIVTFKHKAGKVFTDDFNEEGARYIVNNVLEGLDAPGEWYLNRQTGVLSYIPMPGEDIAVAEVIAPVGPAFLSFKGNAVERQFVEHLTFRNLSFMYTNWQLPPGNSNDNQGSASVPAAITATGMREVTFENCTIKNIGTYAFELQGGCTYNRFIANELSYLAAGGFRINGGTERNNPLERTGYNEITNNRLHHYGEVYPSAVGVLLQHTNGNIVANNDIHHGWYTGISIGWSWGYQRSVSRDNIIAYNHIHTIGQGLLSDMGGVYTLGVSPGTVVRNNLIHDVDANKYGGWGIYNDEGSTHILVEDNIVYNTKFAGYNIHYAKEITVHNNIFAFGRIDQITLGRVEPHVSVYFEGNIVYWKEGVLMQQAKEDKPYLFHFNPNRPDGGNEMADTFWTDWNVYYNPAIPADSVRIGKLNFPQWQERGEDTHSVYADPKFVDPDHYDFRLQNDSPALAMGFKQIDITKIGPRR